MKILRNEKGFVLPLSVLLMLVLSISGINFLFFDLMEKKTGQNEFDNQGAFYLASAGMERARESFKAPGPVYNWTSTLNDSSKTDTTPDARLCPFYDPANPLTNRGCVIPPFGAVVSGANSLGFDSLFDRGSYQVRAFNDEPGTTDTNSRVTFRALGNINGQEKLVELQGLHTVTGMNLINCLGDSGDPCPDRINGNPTVDAMDGRDPDSSPVLPTPSNPLTSSSNYYRQIGNFPTLAACTFTGTLQSNCYYFISGNATIKNASASNVIIFATGTLSVKTGNTLNDTILIGVNKVEFQGNGTIRAPSSYPAVISAGNVTKSSGSATIYGNIYAGGTINFNPIDVHGALIGNTIEIQGSGSTYTDDNNPAYYDPMPGFYYPPELLSNESIGSDTWSEIE